MRKFPCVFMRGGTSKGCMFLASDLPARDQWDDIFVQAMGSPDPKQTVRVRPLPPRFPVCGPQQGDAPDRARP